MKDLPNNASTGELAYWNDWEDLDRFTNVSQSHGYGGVYTWVATADAMDWRVHRRLYSNLNK